MFELAKHGELLIYLQRALPYGRNLQQKILGKVIYPWNLAMFFPHLGERGESYFVSSPENVFNFIQPTEHEFFTLRTLDPRVRLACDCDGAHTDIWSIYQKGLSDRSLRNFVAHLNQVSKGYYSEDKPPSFSKGLTVTLSIPLSRSYDGEHS